MAVSPRIMCSVVFEVSLYVLLHIHCFCSYTKFYETTTSFFAMLIYTGIAPHKLSWLSVTVMMAKWGAVCQAAVGAMRRYSLLCTPGYRLVSSRRMM
jgi:hypothetical protein